MPKTVILRHGNFRKLAITPDRIEIVTVIFKPIACAVLFSLVSASGAAAQIMIDVSRITCQQFLHDTITVPDNIGYWLAGYYDAQLGNTEFDINVLKHNVSKLEDYCEKHQDVTLMTAVETLLNVSR
jgi:acid stress chaperone HdeB